MKGRKPKSKKAKILSGTFKPKARSKLTFTPLPRGTKPPAWLPKAAKELWRKLAPVLSDVGLLTVVDQSMFTVLCCSYADYIRVREQLEREGPITTDERGLSRKHPLYMIMRQYRDAFRQLCNDFGLCPTSRQRLDIDIPNVVDSPLEELLSRGKRRDDEDE